MKKDDRAELSVSSLIYGLGVSLFQICFSTCLTACFTCREVSVAVQEVGGVGVLLLLVRAELFCKHNLIL